MIENLENEIWKDIKGYEGLYQVSNLGRIKMLDRVVLVKSSKDNIYKRTYKGKIMSLTISISGYKRVSLADQNGIRKNHRIHRLVAETFIPNPNNYPCVNHKDEVKTNNCVDNLEWCTQKYNVNYGTSRKRSAEHRTNDPNLSKRVLQYSLGGKLIKEWPSTAECGRYGFNQANIAKCCANKKSYHTAYGYIWKYKEE